MNLGEQIKFIDFHTHHGMGSSDTVAVMNLMAGEDVPQTFQPNTAFSAGIHPWYLTAELFPKLKTELILTLAHPHVITVGEAGFDQLRGPSHSVQRSAFIFQAQLAEELKKPMVIHCVKAWDTLRKVRKELKPEMKWVIHGFRGTPGLAGSLADDGLWFSLGINGLTEEILNIIPAERLLLETDDSKGDIGGVYMRYSELTGINGGSASDQIRTNFNNLFRK
ncbi:MAG TPA: TatD family hydrolase [Bacteroidales bacterium]|nr:TatD family hydrolase [Bacteroidales bacterium]